MKTRSGIVAGGNWIVDRVKTIDTWPPEEALATIVGESMGNGGSPYNVLVDLAQLKAPFPLRGVGLVGDDPEGRWIRDDCRARGIDTTQLRTTAEARTSYTDVMTIASSGRRTFFHQRGANALLAPEHFSFTGASARIFHLGYLLLLDELDRLDAAGQPRAVDVFRRARAAGMLSSLDCVSENGDRFLAVVGRVLPEVDVLFANDFEAEKLTGERLRLKEGGCDFAAVERAAAALVRAGVRSWVIVHMPEAVHACGPRGESHWQASVRVPRAEIRGTAGAGDAFAAGVLYGLHEDWPMAQALELGVCAAASSLCHPTCSQSIRPAAECLAHGRRLGYGALGGS